MRALIVDDSRATRTILKKILKEIGFETTEAENGAAGVKALAADAAFDLALVDWNMPEMNGYDFVCAVRAMPALDHVKLMMVTSETATEQIVKALEKGANEYLMKPFNRDAILEKLTIMGIEPDSHA